MTQSRNRMIATYPADGLILHSVQDAMDFIGDALSQRADLVAIPADRLGPSFFQLRTGFAGELLQKFVNYHMQVAITGDISAQMTRSNALRDFVIESNRGRTVWFLADVDELQARLAHL